MPAKETTMPTTIPIIQGEEDMEEADEADEVDGIDIDIDNENIGRSNDGTAIDIYSLGCLGGVMTDVPAKPGIRPRDCSYSAFKYAGITE